MNAIMLSCHTCNLLHIDNLLHIELYMEKNIQKKYGRMYDLVGRRAVEKTIPRVGLIDTGGHLSRREA